MMCQVKYESNIANYENTHKSKTSNSNLSKTWREKRQNMQDIRVQKISFLQFNIIINIVVLVLIGGW